MAVSGSENFDPMAIDSLLNSDENPFHQVNDQNQEYRQRKFYKSSSSRPGRSLPSHRPIASLVLRPVTSLTATIEHVATPIPSGRYNVQTKTSSRATQSSATVRAPRPKYEEQQAFFIWYHRTDLSEPWDQVLREFGRQFHHRRPKGGLQCKFYRLLEEWNVEKVRIQNRHARDSPKDRVGAFGVVQRTTKRFSWMRPHHYISPPLPQFSIQPPASPVSCSGCSDCG